MSKFTKEELATLKELGVSEEDVILEELTPFDEAMAIMDEYVNSITLVGKVPTLESTNHLGEETDEENDPEADAAWEALG